MFDDVPEPVWKTSIGNWASSSPFAIRSAAAAMRCALSSSRSPSSPFARAAAALMRPSQRATEAGIGSPETGKLTTAFVVSPPQSSSRVDAVSVTASTLAGDANAAVGEYAIPQLLAQDLVQLLDERPADVGTTRALVLRDVAPLAAVQALDHGSRSLRFWDPGVVPLAGDLVPPRFQQFVPHMQLYAGSPEGFSRLALRGVDRLPPLVLDEIDALGVQDLLE